MNKANKGFVDNTIRNTKYHWWSFLFCTIFQQVLFVFWCWQFMRIGSR